MPHAVFSGTSTSSENTAARPLIPGVEPGGSRAGKSTKPALLIRDCRAIISNLDDTGTAADFTDVNLWLRLSQEQDLDPAQALIIASVLCSKTATAQLWNSIQQVDQFMAQGTLWAPAYVGIQIAVGAFESVEWTVHLDYDRIDVPWRDWFIMWEYLDNIVDGTQEY